MKILITGSSGMLGRALCERLMDTYDIVGLDIDPNKILKFEKYIGLEQKLEFCNITDHTQVSTKIRVKKPDVVIHTAAYTDVDGCEKDRKEAHEAHQVNAVGTQNVAQACKDCNCLLIYISTDFVFDGEKKSAYIEQDLPNPINIYGKSKLDGERYVQSILEKFIIVRSSWLFGKGGENFVDALLMKTKQEKETKVVNNQFGSPTYTKDLAMAIDKLINLSDSINGIYHITNSGSCSRYEFALAIREIANLDVNIIPISSEQYSSPTKRPKMSILENKRYQKLTGGGKLRHWKEALKEYISK